MKTYGSLLVAVYRNFRFDFVIFKLVVIINCAIGFLMTGLKTILNFTKLKIAHPQGE